MYVVSGIEKGGGLVNLGIFETKEAMNAKIREVREQSPNWLSGYKFTEHVLDTNTNSWMQRDHEIKIIFPENGTVAKTADESNREIREGICSETLYSICQNPATSTEQMMELLSSLSEEYKALAVFLGFNMVCRHNAPLVKFLFDLYPETCISALKQDTYLMKDLCQTNKIETLLFLKEKEPEYMMKEALVLFECVSQPFLELNKKFRAFENNPESDMFKQHHTLEKTLRSLMAAFGKEINNYHLHHMITCNGVVTAFPPPS